MIRRHNTAGYLAAFAGALLRHEPPMKIAVSPHGDGQTHTVKVAGLGQAGDFSLSHDGVEEMPFFRQISRLHGARKGSRRA